MNEREAFLTALAENEDDETTRLVFADFLDEHDEPEEADRMRKWRASKQWMTDWVRSINYGKWEYDDDGEYVLDVDGSRVPAKTDNLGDPHTLKDAIEAGHAAVQGKFYSWRTDAGSDYFHGYDMEEGDYIKVDGVRQAAEWFRHWSILTGVEVPGSVIESPPFCCAC